MSLQRTPSFLSALLASTRSNSQKSSKPTSKVQRPPPLEMQIPALHRVHRTLKGILKPPKPPPDDLAAGEDPFRQVWDRLVEVTGVSRVPYEFEPLSDPLPSVTHCPTPLSRQPPNVPYIIGVKRPRDLDGDLHATNSLEDADINRGSESDEEDLLGRRPGPGVEFSGAQVIFGFICAGTVEPREPIRKRKVTLAIDYQDLIDVRQIRQGAQGSDQMIAMSTLPRSRPVVPRDAFGLYCRRERWRGLRRSAEVRREQVVLMNDVIAKARSARDLDIAATMVGVIGGTSCLETLREYRRKLEVEEEPAEEDYPKSSQERQAELRGSSQDCTVDEEQEESQSTPSESSTPIAHSTPSPPSPSSEDSSMIPSSSPVKSRGDRSRKRKPLGIVQAIRRQIWPSAT